jgi:hypothetical protein
MKIIVRKWKLENYYNFMSFPEIVHFLVDEHKY